MYMNQPDQIQSGKVDQGAAFLLTLLQDKPVPTNENKDNPQITQKELYEMIRKQIEHEDTLVNQRLIWLMLSQAFLFTAFSTILRDIILNNWPNSIYVNIPLIIAIVGFLLSLFSFSGILAAFQSLRHLRETWYETLPDKKETGKINAGFPQITWVGNKRFRATNTAYGTPIIIMIMWVIFGVAFFLR